MVKLHPQLKAQFKAALSNYHKTLRSRFLRREIDFIDLTVASFQNLNFFAGNQNLKTRSKRIHLTPQVRFCRYGFLFPNKSITVEMGDLLFVFKHFLDGVLEGYRAVIVQAKYTADNKRTWKIDTNQFYLLTEWPSFRIVRPTFNRLYSLKPRAFSWAMYGFVGPNAANYPIYYSSERMLRQIVSIPKTNPWNFDVQPLSGWDSSTSFFSKFIQGFAGENLLSNPAHRALVNDLYIVAGWKPDPPEEPRWENMNAEKKGFGIVEFVVASREREE
jgi:hypothetical protein